MLNREEQWASWVLNNRIIVIVISVVMTMLAAYGASRLEFSNNHRVYFGEDNPQLIALEKMENVYTKNDNVTFVFAVGDGDIFNEKVLLALRDITERAWQMPYSSRVDSITNYQHSKAVDNDLEIRSLVPNEGSLNKENIDLIKNIALKEPLLINKLLSPNGRVTAINIAILLPRIDEASELPEVVAFSQNLLADIKKEYPFMDAYLTGGVMMDNAFVEATKKDIDTLIPLSFAVMLIMLSLLVGGIMGTLATLLVIAFSIAGAMGLGGYIGFPLTPPSVAAPIIILAIAIANCVHILTTFKQRFSEMKNDKESDEGDKKKSNKYQALHYSLSSNLRPVTIASLTTVIGFLSMNFSDVPPFQHLGNLVAMGVLLSLVMSVSFLPALLSLLPASRRAPVQLPFLSMNTLSECVIKHHNRFFWGVGFIAVILVASISRNELNDVFVHYFDEKSEFRQDTDFVLDNLTGFYNIEYSMESGESGGVYSPEFLQQVDGFSLWLRQQPEVLHVNTVTDTIKRLNKNMFNDDEAMYRLPDDRNVIAQYILLYEMSLPYGLDLNNQINVNKSSVRLLVTIKTLSTGAVLDFEDRAQQWLTDNTPQVSSSVGTGTVMMFSYIGQRNIISMLVGTTAALVLISLVLMAAFKSWSLGVVSLLPNLIPAAMGFGLWGLLVGEVGLALSTASAMTLGIVVDDTVHFLTKYHRARKEMNASVEDAIRYAYKTVGQALVTTTVVLVSGFLVLASSGFELNSGMGLLTAIVITIALLVDLLFLPAVLIKCKRV
ncbi:putative exporter of the RND superfamily [gamma proteobacterium IMCC1989]|nr:putative exporter of the RND superfamily [gamma proteobacterium IMCC1989]